MNFLWPQFLWLLAALPLLVLLYLWLIRRKKKMAVRYASLSIVREAMGPGQSLRRHLPPLLFLLAMAAMLIAASRPMAVVVLPSNQQTIILAMDVSGSMRAADVLPNRLVAAQEAAKSFIKDLPRSVKMGIVAFAGSAQVAQLPTTNHEDLVTAIDSFQLQRATATGNAIVVSLATLFPDAGLDVEQFNAPSRQRGAADGGGGAAVEPADDHPGDGRVRQHARHRRTAEPACRRTERCEGLHRRTAAP